MLLLYSCNVSKKLVLKFILEHIEYRKRCLYLQEIIAMGKRHEIWRRALASFFEERISRGGDQSFSSN
jgi:hypothetical protein